MAPERARGASRHRTNQQKYTHRPSHTMTLRSAANKSQDVHTTSKPTTANSISAPVASSGNLLSHNLPLDAHTLSNLAARADVVTSGGSSSLSEAHSSVDVSNTTPHATTTNTYMHNLPSKPLIPVELPATDPSIKRLETFFASTMQLYDKQEASINTTNECIELGAQLCIGYKEILDAKQVIERMDHSCWSCKELAWNPHVLRCGHVVCARCITDARRLEIETGKTCQCPTCRFPVWHKPIPSVVIQATIERLASKLDVPPPAQHILEWPDL
ncbi:hypothetical protein F5890DRAFT_1556011 [Lentinula detonsa]|uniref:RING-type domain-containing protein n=1 Tax=Lentinula detonsa TaxID=2804962 RepID=A0AA38PV82_9AGAR|nr:hypothetical protein F5890DRAFT_1556011 [Lentinula detonsa]